MKYNLFTPQTGNLNYPHLTKLDEGLKKSNIGIAGVVTHPDKIIKQGDIIHAQPSLGQSGHFMGERMVLEVLEQRSARGQHSVDFVPVFQKLKVSKI